MSSNLESGKPCLPTWYAFSVLLARVMCWCMNSIVGMSFQINVGYLAEGALKLQTHSDLRSWYHPKVCFKCLWNEEDGCSGLWGSPSGRTSYYFRPFFHAWYLCNSAPSPYSRPSSQSHTIKMFQLCSLHVHNGMLSQSCTCTLTRPLTSLMRLQSSSASDFVTSRNLLVQHSRLRN